MKNRLQLFVLFLICICSFFVQLEETFPSIMEMRNFITAREMLTEGNWWFTTLNLQPRLEKPPLPTWLTAWSVMAFGDFDNLYSLRIPGAVVATLMVFFFYGFIKEFSSHQYLPFIGAVVMATSVLVIQAGRTNSWDIYTHSFMVGSLWQFAVGIKRKKKWAIFFSMLLMGLSILSKGPVSLYALWLPFVIALGVGFSQKLKKHWGKLLFILIGGLIIGFAWNGYMYLYQQEATEFVINKETNSWVNRHVRSPIFYLSFPIFIGIWLPFLVPFFFYKYARTKTDSYAHYQFVLTWLIGIIVLLSVIPTKKERYVLPALAPMCLAVGYIIRGLYTSIVAKKITSYDNLLLKIAFYLIGFTGIVGPFVLFFIFQDTINTGSITGLLLIILLSLLGIYYFRKQKYTPIFYVPVGIVCIICILLTPNLAQWHYRHDNFISLKEVQHNERLNKLPFYTENMHTDPKMCWLIGKPTKLIEDIDFSSPNQFPLVAVGVNTLDELCEEDDLRNVDYEYFGEFDLFRKKSEWKANVYLLQWERND